MPCQHCTNFLDIAQEKSQANIEQKDKMSFCHCAYVGWQSLDNKKNNSNRFVLFLT